MLGSRLVVVLASFGGAGVRGGVQAGFVGILTREGSCERCRRRLTGKEGKWKQGNGWFFMIFVPDFLLA